MPVSGQFTGFTDRLRRDQRRRLAAQRAAAQRLHAAEQRAQTRTKFRNIEDMPPRARAMFDAITQALAPFTAPGDDYEICYAIFGQLLPRVRVWRDPETIRGFAATLEPAMLEFCLDECRSATTEPKVEPAELASPGLSHV